jgi:hypothetical protein
MDRTPGLWAAPPEDLSIRQQVKGGEGLPKVNTTQNPTFGKRALDERKGSLWRLAQFIQRYYAVVAVLAAPQLDQTLGLLSDDDDLPTAGLRIINVLQNRLELAAEVRARHKAVGQPRGGALLSKS